MFVLEVGGVRVGPSGFGSGVDLRGVDELWMWLREKVEEVVVEVGEPPRWRDIEEVVGVTGCQNR